MYALAAILWAVLLGIAEASIKKGISISNGNDTYMCGDEKAFTHVHWWYDWRIKNIEYGWKGCTNPTLPGYVPLVWGTGLWASTNFTLPDDVHYVLGFNEPNHNIHHQSPAIVAKHWREIEKHSPGRILVSPAAAPCDHCQYDAIPWLEEFFRLCNDCRVEHIATHAYWCNADQIMTYLKQVWDRFHKPIWLTEFACMHTKSVNAQLAFMKEILPKLEAAPYVFRYSWFTTRWGGNGHVLSSASLLQHDAPRLNMLGHYYNNFQA